jgi:hypothetical protein
VFVAPATGVISAASNVNESTGRPSNPAIT